jgi:hypothetical protein
VYVWQKNLGKASAEPAMLSYGHGHFDIHMPEHRNPGAGLVRDDGAEAGDDVYEGVTCLACRQVHMVNPRTGKVLGADEE